MMDGQNEGQRKSSLAPLFQSEAIKTEMIYSLMDATNIISFECNKSGGFYWTKILLRSLHKATLKHCKVCQDYELELLSL